MTKKPPTHQKTFAIEWGDMDALGHVNNGRYFDYFQQARIDWLSSIGFGLDKAQGPVVIQVACTFLKPVIYPATLTLTSTLHSPGRTSIGMNHQLFQGELLMAEATSKLVWIDYKKKSSVPLPEGIARYFNRLN